MRTVWLLTLMSTSVLLAGCREAAHGRADARRDKHAKATTYEPVIELTDRDLGLEFLPGATQVMSARTKLPHGGWAKKVQLMTDEDPAQVYHFYRRRLQPPLLTDLLTGDGPEQSAKLAKSLGHDRLEVLAFRRKDRTVVLLERTEAPQPEVKSSAKSPSCPAPAATP